MSRTMASVFPSGDQSAPVDILRNLARGPPVRGTWPRVPREVNIKRILTDLQHRHFARGRNCKQLACRDSDVARAGNFQVGGEYLDRRAVPRGAVDHVMPVGCKPGRVNRAVPDGQTLKVRRLRWSRAAP